MRRARRNARLSAYAEDRRIFSALVRLRLAVRVERPNGRACYRLTQAGAALFVALMDGDSAHRAHGCGGAR
ncbi:MAG: hypothetical protein LC623_09710 [Halobacteriales archaeon]|nr:hypothetical protein [Halobacteriales archaeon]